MHVPTFFLFSFRFIEFSNIILMIEQIKADILSEIVDLENRTLKV